MASNKENLTLVTLTAQDPIEPFPPDINQFNKLLKKTVHILF